MVNPYTDSVDRIFVKRDRYDIIAKILDIARKGAKKTKILYGANMSYNQLKQYLSFLLEKKLLILVPENPSEKYRTTPKGIEYLESYNESKTLLTI